VKVHNISVGKKSVSSDGKSEKGWAGRVEFVGKALEYQYINNVSLLVCTVFCTGKIYQNLKSIFLRWSGEILQYVDDGIKMMDYQLGCGEKECNQEDEKVGQDLLDQQPLPPERETEN
jgi:hypothetical protein